MAEAEKNARVRCRDIMTASVTTATSQMSLQQVAEMMREGDMGSIPVVDGGKLVGIVTDRDIVVRAVAEGQETASPIANAMTKEVFSV
jgi:CBS domain-containing protein